MPLAPGDKIDRYVIEERIGAGGMGEVYRAHDARLDRRVALKVLRESPTGSVAESEGAARIMREARAAAQLDHPNVVAVFDVGTVEQPEELRGTTYLAMELVVGRSLREFVGDERIGMEQRVQWIVDIGRALGVAHRAGLVHRDVKPENVMIREDGLVKVLDFGIAKRAVGAWSSSTKTAGTQPTTAAGTMVGTPMYMAPEQMRGEAVDGRADQFAWGVLAYELLSGKPPWSLEAGAVGLVAQILSALPAPLPSDVPAPAASAVLRAMAKDRVQRFESMDTAIAALGAPYRTTLPSASKLGMAHRAIPTPAPTSRSQDEPAPIRRAWGARAAAAGAAVTLAVAVLGYGARLRISAHQTDSVPHSSHGCTSVSDCDLGGGAASACRHEAGMCVALASEDCHVLAEPSDLQRDDTLWIGTMYPLTGPDADVYGLRETETVDLARMDFARAMARFSKPDVAGHVRPIALLACDDAVEPARAAKHLAEVGVPAVIGFHRTSDLLDIAASTFFPRRTLVLTPLVTSPVVTRIPEPPGAPRLVWRTTYDMLQGTSPMSQFVERIVEPRARARLGNAALKVAVVREKSDASFAFAEALFARLRFNGKSAVDNGRDYREVVVEASNEASTVAEVLAFGPHIVVYWGSDALVKGVLRPIEERWPDSAPVRPTYLGANVFPPSVFEVVGSSAERRHRFFGMTNVSTTTLNARLVMHYHEVFSREMTRTTAANSSYDAFYLAALASYAVGDGPITGESLARAIPRLLPPGDSIDVGPSGILAAFTALRAGRNVDLNGTFGKLDFDPSTGDALVDQAILCVDADPSGRAFDSVESGLVYDAHSDKLEGALHCP